MRLILWLMRHPRLTLGASAATAGLILLVAAVGIDALARARLDPAGPTPPTRLYSRPVVLPVGERADARRVERALRRLGYRAARGEVDIGEFRLDYESWTIGRRPFRLAGGLDAGGVTRVHLDWDGRIVAVEDENGTSRRTLTLEPEVLQTVHGRDLADRVPVTLADIPQHLVDALLAVEDRQFFEHEGLDFRRIAGAAAANA